MYVHTLRGVPARNCDALKHPLPVTGSESSAIISSSSYNICVTGCLLPVPVYSFPTLPINLSSPILAAISLLLFSIPVLRNGTALHHALLPRATTFFSDCNSSLALSSSFQFQFITLHINGTQGVATSS